MESGHLSILLSIATLTGSSSSVFQVEVSPLPYLEKLPGTEPGTSICST